MTVTAETSTDAFRFLDPGPLADRELELVTPEERWVDAVVASCQHPLTRAEAPGDQPVDPWTTRQRLLDFLAAAPGGRQPADPARGWAPQYNFWMVLRERGLLWRPSPRAAGGVSLRIGTGHEIEMYYGHIGYHVYPPFRGRRLSERACRLLLPLCRAHGLTTLWITCNPDNHASRRTCERLGMRLAGVVQVPESDPLFQRGEREKCRYCLTL
ncbi:MAG TPA: GNAT family N-acetyltransferase [Tepidisphaeraceae bacterium]|nr:GNAT family N-acetyltransferase [Tepidisphaeraceae bacterium]